MFKLEILLQVAPVGLLFSIYNCLRENKDIDIAEGIISMKFKPELSN